MNQEENSHPAVPAHPSAAPPLQKQQAPPASAVQSGDRLAVQNVPNSGVPHPAHLPPPHSNHPTTSLPSISNLTSSVVKEERSASPAVPAKGSTMLPPMPAPGFAPQEPVNFPPPPMGQGSMPQQPAQFYGNAPRPIEKQKPTSGKSLNVKDALSYLDEVKFQFSDQPEIYNRFLDIMKDFKSAAIETPGVIERVSNLFRGRPNLINGFNTFLPQGYHIEASMNPNEPVKVRTPDTFKWSNQSVMPARPIPHPAQQPIQPVPVPSGIPVQPIHHPPVQPIHPHPQPAADKKEKTAPIEFNHAITFVNKVKNRYASEPETYKQFLEILQMYQKEQKPILEIYQSIAALFKDSSDLLEDFRQFLPEHLSAGLPKPEVVGDKRPVPSASSVPKKKPRQQTRPESNEELEFFDKVKRAIGSRNTYNEFLKILNLFSQEIIDQKTLVERTRPFLEKSPDLFEWFKKFVKYDEPAEKEVWNIPHEKPSLDLHKCKQSGHSYRLLPKTYARSECSNRDSLCREVLNDDWISHPVYLSETGFIAHKKNIYEEALYKCEEERYEFDRHIEANQTVIQLLEPIAKQINEMNPDERIKFKLPVGLNGKSKTIYQRVIKKIYDKERGQEIINALHSNPAIAVPIVLKRLKQKDEEWKRCKREWNKVWREIDHRNFSKALDHQGINFKTLDRKQMQSKTMLNDIEVLFREQKEKSALVKYQLDFMFKDVSVFRDCNQLLLNALEALGAQGEEDRIRTDILEQFLPKFFFVNLELSDSKGLGITSSPKLDTPMERNVFSFYANTSLYVFIRLYQMLYSRLYKMKELSVELSSQPAIHEKLNQTGIELGLVKEAPLDFNEKDRYSDLIKAIDDFVQGKSEASDFEDRARQMYTTSAYLVYTMDKLVQSLVKQMQQIVLDGQSVELINLYYNDRSKTATSTRQEAIYRLSAEGHIDDNLYRLEYFMPENVLTVQLIGKEDQVNDESITNEDKWSLYVDHFVQLSTTEGVRLKKRDSFLKRNLPNSVSSEPIKDVETRSGLELKICVNTYRIFFVNNTEDYFRRKTGDLNEQQQKDRASRFGKFRAWLDSENGWKRELAAEPAQEMSAAIDEWLSAGMQVETVESTDCKYRRFALDDGMQVDN